MRSAFCHRKIFCGVLLFVAIVGILVPNVVSAVPSNVYHGQFKDVSETAWYYESVAKAYEMGIINGVDAVSYNPDGFVTLAECIKLASCIAQKKTEGEISLQNGSEIWYEPYVQYALEKGILSEPQENYEVYADRGRIAQIFSSVLGADEPLKNPLKTLRFRDVTDESLWYYDEVYRLYTCGIMVGDDTYCFHPEEKILRSEIAAAAVRILDTEKRLSHTLTAPSEIETAILMYHNFALESGDYTVTPVTFRSHLQSLRDAGYESITFEELILYTEGKIPLPKKCVLLTADDGYSGVLDIALPLLEEFDMKMSVAVIGEWIGSRGDGTLSHFTLEEVAERDTEGRIELISHSWGLHASGEYMDGAVNLNLREEAYKSLLEADCDKMADAAGEMFPMINKVFVYPYGKYSEDSEAYFRSLGYAATVTVAQGISHISVGDSLSLLKRIPAEWYITGEQLLSKLK